MSLADDFYQWTTDPARTNDELFVAELIVGHGWALYRGKHKLPCEFNWDAIHRLQREQNENPAYRSHIARSHLEGTVEMWADIKILPSSICSQRPIRNLSVLRFFPHIEEISINCCEVADLSPVAGLRSLRKLGLAEYLSPVGHALVDLSPITGLPHLAEVLLNLDSPWPDLSALATLPALRELRFEGNLLALAEVPSLPTVENVTFGSGAYWSTPMRTLHALPAMPKVRLLSVGSTNGINATGTTTLDGIERYPHIVNLTLSGVFRDLRPLAALQELTCLTLFGELFTDLRPLAALPRLRELTLLRERPLDIEPLSEVPALREVSLPRCLILETELGALHAGLQPWSEDFLAPEPRTLPPLRWFRYVAQNAESKLIHGNMNVCDPRAERYAHDPALLAAESRWRDAEIKRRLDAILGEGWNTFFSHYYVRIQRYQDVQRLPEIIECLRRFSADCLDPIHYCVCVEPHGDIPQDGWLRRRVRKPGSLDWLDHESTLDEEREDREDYRRTREEHLRRLEREHRHEILRQQGHAIDPKDFSPPTGIDGLCAPEPLPEPEEPEEDDAPAGAASAGFDTNDDEEENEDAGSIAEPPPAPPGTASLGEDLSFSMHVSEHGVFVVEHQLPEALAALSVTFENWHDLPLPPESRPLPQ